jgi:uncharacterized membrane protein HdeD (DUF308 family)
MRVSGDQASLFIGGALILVGIFYLLDNLNVYWLSWLKWDVIWPFVLIAAGVLFLVRQFRGE